MTHRSLGLLEVLLQKEKVTFIPMSRLWLMLLKSCLLENVPSLALWPSVSSSPPTFLAISLTGSSFFAPNYWCPHNSGHRSLLHIPCWLNSSKTITSNNSINYCLTYSSMPNFCLSFRLVCPLAFLIPLPIYVTGIWNSTCENVNSFFFPSLDVTPSSIFPIQENILTTHQGSKGKNLGVILDPLLFFILQNYSVTEYLSVPFPHLFCLIPASLNPPHFLLRLL